MEPTFTCFVYLKVTELVEMPSLATCNIYKLNYRYHFAGFLSSFQNRNGLRLWSKIYKKGEATCRERLREKCFKNGKRGSERKRSQEKRRGTEENVTNT